jgi:hypothetical protein
VIACSGMAPPNEFAEITAALASQIAVASGSP